VSDITVELERERAESERRELMAVFERISTDRNGFIDFCDEADDLVGRIRGGEGSSADLPRQIHTLKGNAAIFGVESIASYCHVLETRLLDEPGPLIRDEQLGLATRWQSFTRRLEALLGRRDIRRIEITDDELQRVLAALRHNEPSADIVKMVHDWRLEPVARRFERVADQANRLARRMGKMVHVDIEDRGVRLDPERWAPFWSTFVHAVRNAIDHGVEDAGERQRAGKPDTATLSLRSELENGTLTIEIRDDGRGVNWERVRDRADKLGIRAQTQEQLVEALFADGVSTKDEVTDLSGRGVGLAALRAAAHAEGGQVTIVSESRRGTCVRFQFPLDPLTERESSPELRGSRRSRSTSSSRHAGL
jgi:two-component system, chemotaxis family, sensor kinase CheA